MKLFLGEHADSGTSFMEGTLMTGFEKRWQVRTSFSFFCVALKRVEREN